MASKIEAWQINVIACYTIDFLPTIIIIVDIRGDYWGIVHRNSTKYKVQSTKKQLKVLDHYITIVLLQTVCNQENMVLEGESNKIYVASTSIMTIACIVICN